MKVNIKIDFDNDGALVDLQRSFDLLWSQVSYNLFRELHIS